MDSHANNSRKRSLDKMIEHMTADVQNSDGQYIQLGFTPPSTPQSHHIWPEYAQANVNSPSLQHFMPHAPVVHNTAENTVYYTDLHIPYEMDVTSHVSKQPEVLQQSGFYYSPPRQPINMLHDNHELIGTVLDMGGGNVVNVVYGSRPPAVNSSRLMTQHYHMIPSDTQRELVPHALSSFVPYQDVLENSGQNHIDEFGLFGASEQSHAQTLQQPHQQPVAQPQQQPFQPAHGSTHGQLIENLVGNWVPNQSGTYSPFGCTDTGICPAPTTNQQTTQTVPEGSDAENDAKNMGHGIRKTRIVAEVKPMRPSYSDVLAKSAPATSNNCMSLTKHTSNNMSVNSGSSVKAETTPLGKPKGSNLQKSNSKKLKNSVLKRQHSSGSEEQSINGSSSTLKTVQSPSVVRRTAETDTKHVDSVGFSSLPRKWVSLDDLDNEKQNPSLEEEDEEDDEDDDDEDGGDDDEEDGDPFHSIDTRIRSVTSSMKSCGNDCQMSRKSYTSQRSKNASQEDRWEGGTLNNHKVSACPTATTSTSATTSKASSGVGNAGTGNKRPIQINNNLGTPVWNQNRVGCTRNNKPNSEERKGNSTILKGEAKAGSQSSGRSASCRGAGASSASPLPVSQNGFGGPEKAAQAKRNQRGRKRTLHSPIAMVCQPIRQQIWRWGQMVFSFLLWFMLLLSDVLDMSTQLLAHLCVLVCAQVHSWSLKGYFKLTAVIYQISIWPRNWWKGSTKSNSNNTTKDKSHGGIPASLENNISLPCTGEEAMKRLLACKGKDPYSILGVTPHSSDDDIKKYYKRQAFLVHPDKNNQPGAEEAFKILVHAFELIGEPERRKAYDRRVAETQQVEQAWSELNDLLSQLHQKMEYAANTIRCTNCGKRHRRISVDRPCYAARLCAQCKIHHAAREGDIWAESSMLGFLWHYYACMDGAIYDITEWAACQADNLRHLRANTHTVQYRIVLGRHQPPPRHRGPEPHSEADLENFLNNLYSHSSNGEVGGNRSDQGRSRRKGRKKK
ncbi:uncharacterized protein LOC126477457 isoform X1 [Schistocerca serialis cubense]|uniref:uncharacterized protein LOC126477457 isoform X1 n=1 Tax=Schistocerca serialis cubense TaxID=2023355 RepID=UPI00214EB591|nr:uncharacterized protein LOC126477457 isoform X1 [Schistocerca serialis cubense]